MSVTALAGWFGSNRMLAPHVGKQLSGCTWVGVPFAGGMTEILEMTARTILVNDLHRHIINLARVVKSDELRPKLIRELKRTIFHPDELADAQNDCRDRDLCQRVLIEVPDEDTIPNLQWAIDYFVCCWMGRASKAGIDDEFNGRPAFRWNASGGDSVVRYRSAIKSLVVFGKVFRRCSFETMDAFDFVARCEDKTGHGVYCDPPFPNAGRRYKHNCGETDAEERVWHTRLRNAVSRFTKTRIVMRFYDHELIRELYPESEWEYLRLKGRKQSNESAEELLLVKRGVSGLFDTLPPESTP
jgi:DNA adenine methylase